MIFNGYTQSAKRCEFSIANTSIPLAKRLMCIGLLCMGLLSCSDPNDLPDLRAGDNTQIGFVSVPLDVSALNLRSNEALMGNIITDAMKTSAIAAGYTVDIAVTNSGAIRFDPIANPNAIFPAGPVTREDLLNFLPFDNNLVVITVTGGQLKEVFERSVAGLPGLPSPPGQFLQVSQGVTVFVDLLQQPQVVDQNQTPSVIVTPGERITDILINSQPYDERLFYTIVTNEFIASGGDGFSTFAIIAPEDKIELPILDRDALEDYFMNNSPVSPVLEDRINIID